MKLAIWRKFHLRNKHVFLAFIAWWKPRQMFGGIREQISENPRRSWGFLPAREFSQTFPRFSPGYEGTDIMFYFFYKIIFCFNKEKDFIRSAFVYLNFFHETVTSHNLKTEATILPTSFRSSYPYENTHVDQSKRLYYPHYFKKCFDNTSLISAGECVH